MQENNMPAETKEVFDDTLSEVFHLESKWLVFRELFGDEDHVNLLNRCAPATFSYFLYALLDDVNMSLTRLITDEASIHGHANSNFAQLIKKIDPNQHQSLIMKLEDGLSSLKEKCGVFKMRRNRLLAHRDWNSVQPTNPEEVAGISRAMVEDILLDVEAFLDSIYEYFNHRHYMLSPYDILRDVEGLFELLEAGSAALKSATNE